MTGKVVRAFADKRFGFIRDNGGSEYFFHASDFHGNFSDLADGLDQGVKIEVDFDSTSSDKGLRAANVRVIPTS